MILSMMRCGDCPPCKGASTALSGSSCEAGIDEAPRFTDLACLAQLVRQIREHLAQRFLETPLQKRRCTVL
jgi:hypothetical protein